MLKQTHLRDETVVDFLQRFMRAHSFSADDSMSDTIDGLGQIISFAPLKHPRTIIFSHGTFFSLTDIWLKAPQ